jgi:hypothetical protein
MNLYQWIGFRQEMLPYEISLPQNYKTTVHEQQICVQAHYFQIRNGVDKVGI